jgi:hypothetical protein
MKHYLLPLLLAVSAAPAQAQQFIPDNRALATLLGAGTGMAGGSFMSVSIVVLESRYGRYIHDIDDVIGWRSLPAVSGVVIGGGMGALSPRRLEAALIYGTAGIFAGGLVGAGVGKLLWDGPEAKWAGASIGVGVGLGVGTIAGIIWPVAERDGDGEPAAAGIPISFRVTF